MVLCNNIARVDENLFDNLENGNYSHDVEIFQYYIVNNHGAEYLKNYTREIVFYSDLLDVYVLGVTHFGMPWEGVDVEIIN